MRKHCIVTAVLFALLLLPTHAAGSVLDAAERALEAGDSATAIRLCEEGLARRPDDLPLRALKGRALLHRADFRAAAAELAAVAHRDPRDPFVRYDLGRLELARGHFDDAVVHFLHSRLLADTPDTRRGLVQALSEAGLYDWAREEFRRARERFPSDPLRTRLEERLLRRLGRTDEALELYPENGPTGETPGEAVNRLMNRGLLLLALQKPEEAELFFHRALQFRPQMTRLHAFVAEAHAARGDRTGAEELYAACLQLEQPGEAAAELRDREVSPSPCLDIVMANILVRLGRFRQAGDRLRAIYQGYAGGALAAVLFDDPTRAAGAEDPSFLRSYAWWRDGQTEKNPPLAWLREVHRRDRASLEALLAVAEHQQNEAVFFALRLLIDRLARDFPLLPAGLTARLDALRRRRPDTASGPAVRAFFQAADEQAAGRFPEFSRHFSDYLDVDPELLLIRHLLDAAAGTDLAALQLEGSPPPALARPDPARTREELLLRAVDAYLQGIFHGSPGERLQETVEALLRLDAAAVARSWLEALADDENAPAADACLALERLAFDAGDFAAAAGWHGWAEALPDHDTERTRKSLSGLRGGEPDRLVDYFSSLPEGPYRRYNLILNCLRRGEAPRAGELLQASGHAAGAADDPLSLLPPADLEYLRGRLALLEADFVQAETLLRRAAAAMPGNPEPRKYLGILYFARSEADQARQALEEVRKLGGGDLDLLRYLAAACEQLGDPAAAEDAYRNALNFPGPGADLARDLYAEFLQRQGRPAEAVNLYRQPDQARDPSARFQAGRLLLALGSARDALEELNAAEQLLPGSARIAFYRALALDALGHRDEATETMHEAGRRFPSDGDEEDALHAPYPCRALVEASTRIALGQFAECRQVLRAHFDELARGRQDLLTDTEIIKGRLDWEPVFRFLLRRQPDALPGTVPDNVSLDALNTFLSAQARSHLGEALRAGRHYLNVDPELTALRWRAGEELARRQATAAPATEESFIRRFEKLRAEGRQLDAEALARATVSADPERTDAWNALGEILWARGELPEAARAFAEVLARDPDHRYAHIGAGAVARGRGDFLSAAGHFFQAARLNPNEEKQFIEDGCWSLVSAGQATRAVEILQECLPRFDWPDSLLSMADGILQELGAEASREILLEAGSSCSALARRLLLDLYQDRGDDPLPRCREFLAAHPEDPELAVRLIQGADPRRDRVHLQQLLSLPANTLPSPLLDAARALLALGEHRFQDALRSADLARQAGGESYALLQLRCLLAADAPGPRLRAAVRDLPDRWRLDTTLLCRLLDETLRRGGDRSAQRLVNACQDRDPHQPVWRVLQALVAAAGGRPAEGEAVLAELPARELTAELLELRLELLRDSGQFATAEALLLERLDDPLPRNDRLRLFSFALREGWYQAAFAAWKGLDPGGIPLADDLRWTLQRLPADRLFALQEAIPEAAEDDGLQQALAEAEIAAGRLDQAAARLEGLDKVAADNPALLLTHGRLDLARGQFATAAERLAQAAAGASVGSRLLGEIRAAQGQVFRMQAEFATATDFFRESLNLRDDPAVWKELGICEFVRGQEESALQALKQALQRGGEDPDVLRYLAMLQERRGELAAAEEFLRRALDAGGGGMELAARRLADFYRRHHRLGDALAVYRQRSWQLRSADTSFNLGLLTLEAGAATEAVELLTETLSLEENFQPRTAYYLGLALVACGRTEAAAEQFRHSLASFNAGIDDTIDGRTPYPCRAIVHAMAAIACAEWSTAGQVLRAHLEELRRGTNDLLSDTELIRGNLDFITPFRFALGRNPGERRRFSRERIDSVFHFRHHLLDRFLAAQGRADLKNALNAAEAYLRADPQLIAVRERLDE